MKKNKIFYMANEELAQIFKIRSNFSEISNIFRIKSNFLEISEIFRI